MKRRDTRNDGRVHDREYGWVNRRTVAVICTSCEQITRVHANAINRRGGVHCQHCGGMTTVASVSQVRDALRNR